MAIHQDTYYERTLLLGSYTDDEQSYLYSMDELKNLAESCLLDVIGMMHQRIRSVTPKTYFGSGKLEEVKQRVIEEEIEIVVLNDSLSPSQMRNIQTELGCDVVDRHTLILDIFARRAKTKEAKLQVEIAQLQYLLPRINIILSNFNERLGKRGTGEAQHELNRRKIEQDIVTKERELAKMVDIRKVQRQRRKKNNVPVVALVGYTNAGKSSLMNAFLNLIGNEEEKQVYVENQLFATLETTTRNIQLANNRSFLLTDTVGFVSRLPHGLIKAFRSTLEEVTEADLILHVIDASHSEYEKQMKTTEQVLKEIGVIDIPIISVFNKIDLVTERSAFNSGILISAKHQYQLDKLIQAIEKELFQHYYTVPLLIPYTEGSIYHFLKEEANVIEEDYKDDGIHVLVELSEVLYHKYKYLHK